MSYRHPLNDPDHSRQRLDKILSSKRLTFNPYLVSDERLLEIVENTGWGDEYDIVEAVTLTFTRLHPVADVRRFNGLCFTLGHRPEESLISTYSLIYGATAFDSLVRERTTVNHKRITNSRHVESLAGERVFISRIIRGRNIRGEHRCAYKMTKLSGKIVKDAAEIRKAMCGAKIEMLNRILAYPDCDLYLNCSPDFIDYRGRILRAIRIIESWSLNTPPNA